MNISGKTYIRLSGGTGPAFGAPNNVLKTTGANPSTLGIALYIGGSGSSKSTQTGCRTQEQYGYEITKAEHR